jgi:hypothetical protein
VEAKSIFSGESTAVMMLAKTFLAFLHLEDEGPACVPVGGRW